MPAHNSYNGKTSAIVCNTTDTHISVSGPPGRHKERLSCALQIQMAAICQERTTLYTTTIVHESNGIQAPAPYQSTSKT